MIVQDYSLFITFMSVFARGMMKTVVNFISKGEEQSYHMIRNMGTRGSIAKGSQIYDMNEIIHGYVISVMLKKFRMNANI